LNVDKWPRWFKLLKAPKSDASFHDFEEFERLVEVVRSEALAHPVVLLGGEAGLRCGEMMALDWTDIDFAKRQLTVARSEWKGLVTLPKGGRLRYVPITRRLTETLREARHLRGPRVLCDGTGQATHLEGQSGTRSTDRETSEREASDSLLRHNSVRIWRRVTRRRGPSRSSRDIRTSARRSGTCT
jgi:integrase